MPNGDRVTVTTGNYANGRFYKKVTVKRPNGTSESQTYRRPNGILAAFFDPRGPYGGDIPAWARGDNRVRASTLTTRDFNEGPATFSEKAHAYFLERQRKKDKT